MPLERKRTFALVAAVAVLVSLLGATAVYLPSVVRPQTKTTSSVHASSSQETGGGVSSTVLTSTVTQTATEFFIDASSCKGNCAIQIPWPSYESLANLTNSSSFVGVANVTSASVVDVDGVPVSQYNITVVQDIVPNPHTPPGSNWTVAEIGGSANGTSMSVEGLPSLVVGNTYVLFLDYSGNFLVKYYGTNLTTLGGPEGLFYLQGGKVYSLDNLFPQADAWLPVKASGIPLPQFIQEVQSAATVKK